MFSHDTRPRAAAHHLEEEKPSIIQGSYHHKRHVVASDQCQENGLPLSASCLVMCDSLVPCGPSPKPRSQGFIKRLPCPPQFTASFLTSHCCSPCPPLPSLLDLLKFGACNGLSCLWTQLTAQGCPSAPLASPDPWW